MSNKIYAAVSLALWISVLIMIFCLSQQNSAESSQTSGEVLLILQRVLGSWLTSGFVRTAAHFTEYVVLGFLTVNLGYSFRGYVQPFASALTGIVYAVSDEIHQIFIPGRACQLQDLAVDTAGVFCGVVICTLLIIFLRSRKKGREVNA